MWHVVDDGSLAATPPAEPRVPLAYTALRLDVATMLAVLDQASSEAAIAAESQPVVLTIPSPDGRRLRFAIQESSVMEPALAAAWPEIRTFAGRGIDDPAATARFDWTPAGFHAMVLSPGGAFIIDPYGRGDAEHYISYYTRDAGRNADIRCMGAVEPILPGDAATRAETGATDETAGTGRDDTDAALTPVGPLLRTYRLAVAATGEYTAVNGGTVGSALAAITTTINRVTGIYEQQFGIRLTLIANETAIIYTNGATDPYTNGCRECVLSQNQSNLDAVIGTANYDIGHVFMSFGGGFAFFASVCNPSSKAFGSSGGSGFLFDLLVSHEFGHQFDARHTFNGTTAGCTLDQRSAFSAWEPGSGSTIMSYAGSCGAEDLQPEWDPYFHSGNYNQVVAFFTSGGGTCGVQTATGNTAPLVDAGPNFTIPIGTPFVLTASGTDPDGDLLTYGWEELDTGTASPPNTDDGSRPIFRSFTPVTTPSRMFPRLADILSDVPTLGESLPVTSRTMTFQVAALDNRPGGGGVNNDVMQVTSTVFAGPFAVIEPNTAVTWPGNSIQSVTWSVAGTASPPISTGSVRISLSTDGGLTFPTILAASAPNDGSEDVIVPNTPTPAARVRIEAVGNVYFDMSNENFTIVADPQAPLMTLSDVDVSPVGDDGDGFLEPGEAAHLTLQIRNTGSAAASNVQATLSSATSGVNVITTQPFAYPPLAVGQAATNAEPFIVALDSSAACGQDLALDLAVTFSPGATPSLIPFEIGSGEVSTSVVSYSTPPVPIPDNSPTGVGVPIVVAGIAGGILDLDFSLDGTSCSAAFGSTTGGLSHTSVGDLVVELISPAVTSVVLMNRPGGTSNSGNHFCQTRLDDSAANPIQNISTAGAPYTGVFRPMNPLAAFNGQDPNGAWTLRVADLKAADTGTIRRFSLRITHRSCNALASSPGETPSGAPGVPLTVTRSGADLTLSWGSSCRPAGVDYAVYQGTIGSWYSHAATFCTTQGSTTKTFPGDPGNLYFLVVPQSAELEGSYGRSDAGVERPVGAGACRPQLIGSCP